MVEKMIKIIGKSIFLLSFLVTCLDARVIMEIRSEGEISNRVAVGRPFTLDVVVDDVYGSIQAPTIKGLDGCVVRLVGTYMTMINGTSNARYSYSVRIDKLGTYTIGPAIVHHQQQELASDQLKISVVKDLGVVVQKKKDDAHSATKAFLRLTVDTETPFVGQKMSCTLRFYYQDTSALLQTIGMPELSGFDVKEIGKPQTGTAEIDGVQYHYGQWQWDMYPTKPGEFIIPAYHADYDIPLKDNNNHLLSGFFMFMGNRTDHKRVYSNAITIKVSPLPYCAEQVHAIGSFERIVADIKPGVAKEGDGMVLAIEIEGIGNLQAIATPQLHMPDSLKYYDSHSTIIMPKHSDELPKKRFEFIVQGMKSGDYEIPEQLFTYFDVEKNAYVTLRTYPLSVSIMPCPTSVKKNIITTHNVPQQKDDELIPINTVGQWYAVEDERKPLPWWLFNVLFLLPCLYIAYPLLQERLIVLMGNSVRWTRRRAIKQARKRIENCIKNNTDTELHSIFMQLLKNHAMYHETIDIRSVEMILRTSGLSDDLIAQWNIFFERITHAAYAQSDGKNTDELCGMAKQWLERLEKNI